MNMVYRRGQQGQVDATHFWSYPLPRGKELLVVRRR